MSRRLPDEADLSAAGHLSRRELLRGAALLGGAAALAPLANACAAPSPAAHTMRSRPLGKTGLTVSEIGFGGYPLDDPDVLLYALDRGVTYVDTAHCYRGGASEIAIGKALRGRRDAFVVTTKWCPHHSGQPPKKAVFLAQLDESLGRLATDHVDIVLNHQVGKHSGGGGIERLQNPEMLEAFAAAKQAGKVRFLGVSGHDGDLMEVQGYALASRQFDVLLGRYSHLDYPEQRAMISRAHAQGVGVVAMKTLAGAKGAELERFRGAGTTYKQAALKWVLANPELSNLIISMSSRRQVDEYVAASGAPLTAADEALLAEYAARYSTEVCRFCNACESACPQGVAVADTLRFAMYDEGYGWRADALAAYAAQAPEACAGGCAACAGPCAAACPHGLPVRSLLARAHDRLTDPTA